MSKKPEKQENTLATVSQASSDLALPNEALSIFKEAGGGAQNLEYVQHPFFQISTRGGRFKLNGEPIGNNGVELQAHIMRICRIRSYYSSKYDPSNPAPPDCASIGGIIPDPNAEKKQAGQCANCPQNKWGTGTDEKGNLSRGKACKESKRLVLYVEGVDMPCLLSFPPTALKDLDTFLKFCSTFPGVPGGVPAWAVKAKFSFDTKSDYSKPTVEFSELVTDVASLMRLRDLRDGKAYADAETAYATFLDHEDAEGVHTGFDPAEIDGQGEGGSY